MFDMKENAGHIRIYDIKCFVNQNMIIIKKHKGMSVKFKSERS